MKSATESYQIPLVADARLAWGGSTYSQVDITGGKIKTTGFI